MEELACTDTSCQERTLLRRPAQRCFSPPRPIRQAQGAVPSFPPRRASIEVYPLGRGRREAEAPRMPSSTRAAMSAQDPRPGHVATGAMRQRPPARSSVTVALEAVLGQKVLCTVASAQRLALTVLRRLSTRRKSRRRPRPSGGRASPYRFARCAFRFSTSIRRRCRHRRILQSSCSAP